jgi:hypothetical protein
MATVRRDHNTLVVANCKCSGGTMFLAREIFELKKCKLDGRPSGFGVPYRFYVGIKTEFFDFIEQNRTFDSLGEDLGGIRAATVLRLPAYGCDKRGRLALRLNAPRTCSIMAATLAMVKMFCTRPPKRTPTWLMPVSRTDPITPPTTIMIVVNRPQCRNWSTSGSTADS